MISEDEMTLHSKEERALFTAHINEKRTTVRKIFINSHVRKSLSTSFHLWPTFKCVINSAAFPFTLSNQKNSRQAGLRRLSLGFAFQFT